MEVDGRHGSLVPGKLYMRFSRRTYQMHNIDQPCTAPDHSRRPKYRPSGPHHLLQPADHRRPCSTRLSTTCFRTLQVRLEERGEPGLEKGRMVGRRG